MKQEWTKGEREKKKEKNFQSKRMTWQESVWKETVRNETYVEATEQVIVLYSGVGQTIIIRSE